MKRKFTKYPSKIIASRESEYYAKKAKEEAEENERVRSNLEIAQKYAPILSREGYDGEYFVTWVEEEHYYDDLRDPDDLRGVIWNFVLGYICERDDYGGSAQEEEADEVTDKILSQGNNVDACGNIMASSDNEKNLYAKRKTIAHLLSREIEDALSSRFPGDEYYLSGNIVDKDTIGFQAYSDEKTASYAPIIKEVLKKYGINAKAHSNKYIGKYISFSIWGISNETEKLLVNLLQANNVDACGDVMASEICYRDRDNDDRVVALDAGMSDEDVEEMLAAHPSYYRSTLDRFDACDDVDACGDTKYFANMVSASIDDGDYNDEFLVEGYYDNQRRGLAESAETSDVSALNELINEYANKGYYIAVHNLTDGTITEFSPDNWFDDLARDGGAILFMS